MNVAGVPYTSLQDNNTGNTPSGVTAYWAPLKVGDLAISGQAQGDILYFNGTNWVRLPAGTAGKVLKTGGPSANPSWGVVSPLNTFSVVSGQATTSGGTYDLSSLIPAGFNTLNSFALISNFDHFGSHGYSDSVGDTFCYLSGWTVNAQVSSRAGTRTAVNFGYIIVSYT